ncbi:MAG: carboxypeptidase-like regulatory domain-containing protein, partial [candidate division KSB1 bacterium]|nr:carboxypeptidase-like regulatory domain-containing protein [candidate division KSB1 bacterium]
MVEKSTKSKLGGICLVLTILTLFSMMLIPEVLPAQTKGRITGRVTDANTGDFLPGANVFLKGTSLGAATDRAGKYRIENVPPGTFTLAVSYIGYEDFSTEITVTAGSTVEQDAALKVSYVEMEAVVVHGLREGQIKALSQQRTAPNIQNVVAEEQMQRFPDLNMAEVLQRIPAVSIVRDQGEGRYVQIRGTEARLSAVSVNGERITAPDAGERYVGMDVISATQAASIEVVKALTPDMDADAIGGSVNIVTRSAYDSDKPFLHVQTGSGYSEQLGKPLWQGVFTYGTRFGPDQKFGLTVTGNYDYSKRSTWDNEPSYDEIETTNAGTIPIALVDLALRDYIVKRERWNVAGKLDFR